MALDFSILNEDGTPGKSIPLPINLHDEMLAAADKLDADQLLRFKDYYEDVEFAPKYLSILAQQVAELRKKTEPSDLNEFLVELERLIFDAISSQKSIHVIAD